MKTRFPLFRARAGYALITVMILGAISLLVLSASMRRTSTVGMMNDRNNQMLVNQNAAEAAVEKVFSRMAYDFQGGLSVVTANLNNYRSMVPTTNESAYWKNFQFSNAQGQSGTYVGFISNYSGALPSQYPGLFTVSAPIYRVLSNVKATKGRYPNMTNAVQTDVLFALVPLSQYAIFYNSLLEFSTCAAMTVNGRTHANSNIYVGSSSALAFNGTVTATGTITAPANNGGGPWTFPGNVSFNGNPDRKINVPPVSLAIAMTNTHSLIDMPPAGESLSSITATLRLYNQAGIVILVSNTSITAKIQTAPTVGLLNAADPSPTIITMTNYVAGTNITAATNLQVMLRTNLPFLQVTNRFYDQRENKTNLVAQIDVGKYRLWASTNLLVQGKYPAGSGRFPLILYVADNRTTTASQMTCVRITNGVAPPPNNGSGWSVATPNPLYVWGNYNCTNSSHLGTSNTSSTIPSAFLSDALTILSSSWSDNVSYTDDSSGPNASAATTVNAAILTGIKPSTSTATSGFSGGVHNLPRLLEDWGSSHLWINTSIINLYASTRATGQFITPGSSSYYVPPTRHFSFDTNFLDANNVPPGIPCALQPLRINWAVPPPGTVTYYVAP